LRHPEVQGKRPGGDEELDFNQVGGNNQIECLGGRGGGATFLIQGTRGRRLADSKSCKIYLPKSEKKRQNFSTRMIAGRWGMKAGELNKSPKGKEEESPSFKPNFLEA